MSLTIAHSRLVAFNVLKIFKYRHYFMTLNSEMHKQYSDCLSPCVFMVWMLDKKSAPLRKRSPFT